MKTLAIIQLLSTAPFAAAGLRGARTLAFSERKVTTFHEVKLTPENVKPPTLGADNASGVATVQLDYNELRPEAKWKICIQADVHGFTPDKLYIKKALIDQSVESAVVDFSGMLSDIDPYFDGCIKVDEIEFNQILENPNLYYVEALIAEAPTALNEHGVRGQLVHEFSVQIKASSKAKAANIALADVHGESTISFEKGGAVVCIDAKIEGFDPSLAQIRGPSKFNQKILDFSNKKLGSGRFNGCSTLSQLSTSSSTVKSILQDPTEYTFFFQDSNHIIQVRLDNVIV